MVKLPIEKSGKTGMKWKKGKKIGEEVLPKKKDDLVHVLSSYYKGNDSGYTDHKIKIKITKDKSLSLSSENSENFIYLYPEQVKYLKNILSLL